MRRVILPLLCLAATAACTATEVQSLYALHGASIDPTTAGDVATATNSQLFRAATTSSPSGSTSCFDAVRLLFPANAQAEMLHIVKRESGGDAHAQNRRSSASGCAQLLRIHAHRFTKLGYSWADRYNAVANIWVALDLWHEAGWSPWRLTR